MSERQIRDLLAMLQARESRAIKKMAELLKISRDDADAIAQAVWLAQDRLCPAYAAWAAYHVVGLKYGHRAGVTSAAGVLICSCGLLNLDALIRCAVRRCQHPNTWVADILWASLIRDADTVAAVAKEMGDLIGLNGDIKSYIRWEFLYSDIEGSLEYILEDSEGVLMGKLMAKACHPPNQTSSQP